MRLLFLAVALCSVALPAEAREVYDLNLGWRFTRDVEAAQEEGADAPAGEAYNDTAWERVALPHTYELASLSLNDSTDDETQPTFHRGVCWYRRTFEVDRPQGGRVFLEFEGAHQVTDLWVNGTRVGRHDTGGYTPFHFDITDCVRAGWENTVAVRLDSRPNDRIPPDGHRRDYVLFGGLYRDVRLVVTDPLRVTFPWEDHRAGVRLTTPSVSSRGATVTAETTVQNHSPEPQSCRVVTRIADAEGVVVQRLATEITVAAGTTETVVQTGGVYEGVRLWSLDDPHLYRVHTTVERDGRRVDHVVNPLGLRWFELRTGEGFLLNGEPVELIGANRHQQYPYVGDAVPDNLHRADAIKFKRAGVNVVRLAHYPHDDAFLGACDELGILVTEEAPTWIEFGPPEWMDRLERATRVMIRNHRNHPCVWGWGAGINHRGPVRRLQHACKEEDPTRVTMSNSTLWTGPQHADSTDLYSVMDYRGARVPEGAILFAMEHGGSVDARGHMRIVSRYKGEPNRIGLALWCAHDGHSFIKRRGQFQNLTEWNGALWDTFRLPKPAYHWYRSELTDEPMVHLPDARAQREGSATVFTNCDEVELLVNGESLGRREPVAEKQAPHLKAPPVEFPLARWRGVLTAIGYRDGVEAARHSVAKPGKPHHLRVVFDTDGFDGTADGSSIVMAYATVCDRDGWPIAGETPPVTFRVTGPGSVVGDASIGANPMTWRRGVAPALVRVGQESGPITLIAESPGLKPATAELPVRARPSNRLTITEPRERLRVRLDLGGGDQHRQEGWSVWSNQSELTTGEGVTLRLDTVGAPAEWLSSWGVPGDLSFLIEDGITTEGELRLRLEGLPPGEYTLRSWHHRLVDSREKAPELTIRVTDAGGDRVAHERFTPTFGRKIQVSAAGGGGAGDGGSNLAAERPALMRLKVDAGGEVGLSYRPADGDGAVTLNGLELKAVLEKSPPTLMRHF